MTLRTIDDVIRSLDDIIETCYRRGSRLGYFPAMYRKTTVEVKEGLESGRFEEPERMERLDVVFAGLYLDAFRKNGRGEETPAAWEYAFRMGRSDRPSVVQHLLLGMNAHINLDLAISAVEVAPGGALPSLKRDFDEINDILGELVDRVQDDLAHVFPLARTLDFLCLRLDEAAVHFAVRRARTAAWEKAETLASILSRGDREARIADFDREVADFAAILCSAGPGDGFADAAAGPPGAGDGGEAGDDRRVRQIIEALVD